jgi:aerobic-type carbon monoxide dehydrogenase small subunit (CoxS/CutS family)
VTERFRLRVNGRSVEVAADPLDSLRAALGEGLGLRSVREPCGVGACGACTVLVDGRPVRSCLQAVGLLGSSEVTTVEGLAPDDPVVVAFATANAFQCGFCTPGFVLSAKALLAADHAPEPGAVREALAGNLCRCGSYSLILEAVRGALSGSSGAGSEAS